MASTTLQLKLSECVGIQAELDALLPRFEDLPEGLRQRCLDRLLHMVPDFLTCHHVPARGAANNVFRLEFSLRASELFAAALRAAEGDLCHGIPGDGRPSCGDESLSSPGSRLIGETSMAPAVAVGEVSHG